MSTPAIVALDSVSCCVRRQAVLRGVSLRVSRGDSLSIIGPNGGGKTTLLRLIVGLIAPSSGTITLAGLPVDRGRRSLRVGYFGGWATLPPNVAPAAWARLFAVHAPTTFDSRPFGRLSPGSRQHAGLRAVLERRDLDLIVLDEPWDSLDVGASRWLSDSLLARREAGCTIVLSSHRLHELAEFGSRVGLLYRGSFHEPAISMVERRSAATLQAIYDRLRGA